MVGLDPDRAFPTGRPRILIVEDDAPLRAALVFDLEAEGYDTQAFPDAEGALAASLEADCLIVDLTLPGRDGLVLIGQLRARGATMPAILITTDPTPQARRRARTVRAEIVEKPLIGRTLQDRIVALLRG